MSVFFIFLLPCLAKINIITGFSPKRLRKSHAFVRNQDQCFDRIKSAISFALFVDRPFLSLDVYFDGDAVFHTKKVREIPCIETVFPYKSKSL